MLKIDELKRNLYTVLNAVQRAADRVGSRVTVVAATKTVTADIVSAIVELGIKDVGENRVQEYLAKRDGVQGAKWHFIGTLQRNKAKYLAGNVALIQSVSSVALAEEIDRLSRNRGIVQPVLVELNVGDEEAKTGAKTCEIDELVEAVRLMPNIELQGLMAVPPKNAGEEVYRSAYKVYERYRTDTFKVLSLGMSGDYERAIACGSNMVRIGSALFGQREYPNNLQEEK